MKAILADKKDAVESFLKGIYEKHSRVRVIMSGAGTSAFIGDALAPELAKQHKGNVTFDAVATTDIVSNMETYFLRDMQKIMVLFERLGYSTYLVYMCECCVNLVAC